VRAVRARLPVAVDDSMRVAVADERAGALWVFDASGRRWAERFDLTSPCALAFAPDGTLLVAEAGAGRVRRFALEARRDSTGDGGN
jgi:sugar lactone lactonase YvrE